MADWMNKLKSTFGFGEDEEYEEYEEFNQEYNDEDEEIEEMVVEDKKNYSPELKAPKTHRTRKRVDNIANGDMIITVHEPLSYEESPRIVDDLRDNKAVVLNFEQLDKETKQRIFDFVSGALYAIDGKIQKVNKDIFILAPIVIEIDGLKEELKNSGMFPW